MYSLGAFFVCLALFVKESVASTVCVGEFTSFTCVFSACCSDGLFIYCCFSNGAGFGIIFGTLGFFLCLLVIFCRRRRMMMRAQTARTANVTASVATVTTTNTNTGFNNMGYAAYPQAQSYPQAPPQYAK